MKIKGYEAAARPKSRSRKRHSPPSSRSTVGERKKEDQHRAWKSKKKEKNYKEEGNIYSEEGGIVEKSGGREKERDWKEKEAAEEKRVEREGMGVEG